MASTSPSAASVRRQAAGRRFEIELDGELAGFLAYREQGGVLDLVHTEVDPRFEGRGVGGQLVRGALDDARRAGQKVVPSCSFVAAWLERHPDQRDLLAA